MLITGILSSRPAESRLGFVPSPRSSPASQERGTRGCATALLRGRGDDRLDAAKLIQGDVAGDAVGLALALLGRRGGIADLADLARAAGGEGAAARQVGRARHHAFEHDAL